MRLSAFKSFEPSTINCLGLLRLQKYIVTTNKGHSFCLFYNGVKVHLGARQTVTIQCKDNTVFAVFSVMRMVMFLQQLIMLVKIYSFVRMVVSGFNACLFFL